jgi:hypothetical protein
MASSEALWRFDVKEPNKLIAPARHRETITFSWDAPLSPSPMLRHAGDHFNGPTFDAQTSASKGSARRQSDMGAAEAVRDGRVLQTGGGLLFNHHASLFEISVDYASDGRWAA